MTACVCAVACKGGEGARGGISWHLADLYMKVGNQSNNLL